MRAGRDRRARIYDIPYRDRYVCYPVFNIGPVVLPLDQIPRGLPLVPPAFWPKFMLTESDFAHELENPCRGGSMGHYFWTLDLSDVQALYMDLMRALR